MVIPLSDRYSSVYSARCACRHRERTYSGTQQHRQRIACAAVSRHCSRYHNCLRVSQCRNCSSLLYANRVAAGDNHTQTSKRATRALGPGRERADKKSVRMRRRELTRRIYGSETDNLSHAFMLSALTFSRSHAAMLSCCCPIVNRPNKG